MAVPTTEPRTWTEGPAERRREDLNFETEGLVGVVRLRCGHILRITARLEKFPDPGVRRNNMKHLHAESQRRLKEAFDTHDCATYERDLAVQRVTPRLAEAHR